MNADLDLVILAKAGIQVLQPQRSRRYAEAEKKNVRSYEGKSQPTPELLGAVKLGLRPPNKGEWSRFVRRLLVPRKGDGE